MSNDMALFFDGDNTLFECARYYLDAERAFGRAMHKIHGIDPVLASKILCDIDVTCTKLDEGFSRLRYPRSFRAASLAIDAIYGTNVDHVAAEHMSGIGEAVFDAPYPLYPGVMKMLKAYKKYGWEMVLITKGDRAVQQRKIDINQLEEIFEKDHIFIVEKKNINVLADIVSQLNIYTESAYMIGDSIKDDIGPALALNMTTIHIDSRNWKWAYEDAKHTPHHILRSSAHLPTIIPVHKYAGATV